MNYGYNSVWKNSSLRKSGDYNLEDILGRKKRLQNTNDRRNRIKIHSFGDKPYRSPEYSPDFYKQEGTVIKMRYGQPMLRKCKSIREQLGKVDGIFSTYLKLPAISSRLSSIPELSSPIKFHKLSMN